MVKDKFRPSPTVFLKSLMPQIKQLVPRNQTDWLFYLIFSREGFEEFDIIEISAKLEDQEVCLFGGLELGRYLILNFQEARI